MPQFFEDGSAEEKSQDAEGLRGMSRERGRTTADHNQKIRRHHLSFYSMSYSSKTPRSKSEDCETPEGLSCAVMLSPWSLTSANFAFALIDPPFDTTL